MLSGFPCWSSSQTQVLWNLGQIFGLISSFLSNRQLQMVLDGKCSYEYPCWSSLKLYSWSYTFPNNDDVDDNRNCNIAIYAGDTTLYSKCDRASDMWQQLELSFEFGSDL